MNRIKYSSPHLLDGESTIAVENNVRLYDGNQKTQFEGGELIITSHRLLWGRPGQISRGQTCLSLDLKKIVLIEEEPPSTFSFSRSRKVIVHLDNCEDQTNGPQSLSVYNYVKLSFRDGFSNDVISILKDLLEKKPWEVGKLVPKRPIIKPRLGIVGIERTLQEKQQETNENISIAFKDLGKLMQKAEEMVKVSKTISKKVKEKQGSITEDETIRFKSYLLSLGIEDPVTRDSSGSLEEYYKNLAKEISDFLYDCVVEMGGAIGLPDVYCRVNRARSFELLSPEDVFGACQVMERLSLPLRLLKFSSGVMVLVLSQLDGATIAEDTGNLIIEKGSLSSEELSQCLGISLTLAKERLFAAEKFGRCCRDDAIEGLRFYPNLFLTENECS